MAVLPQYETFFAEDMGALRLDFFTLPVLDRMSRAYDGLELPSGYDDPETLEVFARADTDDIPFFDSKMMKDTLRRLDNPDFTALTVVNALQSPYHKDELEEYLEARRSGFRGESEVDEFLAESCGVIVFDEQVMLLGTAAGLDHRNAFALMKKIRRMDSARSALLEGLRGRFMEGEGRVLPKADRAKLWDRLEAQGPKTTYRAHFIANTALAYRCAWLKAHRPEAFEKHFGE